MFDSKGNKLVLFFKQVMIQQDQHTIFQTVSIIHYFEMNNILYNYI
jgi:hypothetical protein